MNFMYEDLFAEVIVGIEPVKLQAALEGQTVKQAHRKGKHMWIEFDSGPCLMLHFGMHAKSTQCLADRPFPSEHEHQHMS